MNTLIDLEQVILDALGDLTTEDIRRWEGSGATSSARAQLMREGLATELARRIRRDLNARGIPSVLR